MHIDSKIFRETLGRFACGVTIATTVYNGQNYGITISSFTSLSLDPPLVLFCLKKASMMFEAFSQASNFAINILSVEQEWISQQFAFSKSDKWQDVDISYTDLGNLPIISDAIAYIECQKETLYEGGDHMIFIGRVIDLEVQNDLPPLLYYKSGYHTTSVLT
jgi:flavin reductase (DIM6/NTAB) family NADH-FMN oxidoreductase RutF